MSDVKRLLEEATPLPWRASDTTVWSEHNPEDPTDWSGDAVAYTVRDQQREDGQFADADLIAIAVNRLPDYEELRETVAAMWDSVENATGPSSLETDTMWEERWDRVSAALRRLRDEVPA